MGYILRLFLKLFSLGAFFFLLQITEDLKIQRCFPLNKSYEDRWLSLIETNGSWFLSCLFYKIDISFNLQNLASSYV